MVRIPLFLPLAHFKQNTASLTLCSLELLCTGSSSIVPLPSHSTRSRLFLVVIMFLSSRRTERMIMSAIALVRAVVPVRGFDTFAAACSCSRAPAAARARPPLVFRPTPRLCYSTSSHTTNGSSELRREVRSTLSHHQNVPLPYSVRADSPLHRLTTLSLPDSELLVNSRTEAIIGLLPTFSTFLSQRAAYVASFNFPPPSNTTTLGRNASFSSPSSSSLPTTPTTTQRTVSNESSPAN